MSRHPQKKWITIPILQLVHENGRLSERCKNNPSDLLLQQEYRLTRNKLTAKLRLSKKPYFAAEFGRCTNNMRKTWGLLNDFIERPKWNKLDHSIMDTFAPESPMDIAKSFKETFEASLQSLKEKSPEGAGLPYIRPTISNSAFLPLVDANELWRERDAALSSA